jgi:hypothetical protein
VLTKQLPDELTLKCHPAIEEANQVNQGIADMLQKNAHVIASATFVPTGSQPISQPKLSRARARSNSLRSKLGRILHRLYDLEPDDEPEKKLNIDLNLYQMETL